MLRYELLDAAKNGGVAVVTNSPPPLKQVTKMPKGKAIPGDALSKSGIPPLPPGVFLAENLLPALKMTLEEASQRARMSVATMVKIIGQKKAVSASCAEKLAELHPDFDTQFG